MKGSPKEIITQEIYDLFDQYVHNRLDRRGFMERLSLMSLGAWTAKEVYNYLAPDYKNKLQTKKSNEALRTEYIMYDSPEGGGQIKAQLSRPKDAGKKLPGIVVVHENRGLNPHIEDVGRRAALEGFISLAPDALTPLGGYPGNDDAGRQMQRQRDRDEMLRDFIAAFYYLKNHPECDGHVGVVGFCFGGYISNMMAAMVPELEAAVPFYGGQVPQDMVEDINAPLLLQYAELDTRVNEGWPEYKAKLEELDKEYTAYFYVGTNHGFHNDTTPRYDEDAATLAWERTIDFFKKHLK